MASEWKDLHRALERAGYRVEAGPRTHWKVYLGEQLLITLPRTPSDRRSWQNALADLRRHAGFTYRRKQVRKRPG